MIKYLLTSKSPMFWLIIHFVLGLLGLISPIPLIIWFYFSLISSFFIVLRPKVPPFVYLAFIVYFISFELLARMSNTSPIIPYEMGKYLFFILLVLGIFKYKAVGWLALAMVVLLIPGILIEQSGRVVFLEIIFNFIGPLNVALAILFFYKKKISISRFKDIIRLAFYPLMGVIAITIFKSPDLGDVEFSLGANITTSGGFGSNQVSTGLGLGAFLIFIFWINRWEFTGNRVLDGVLLVAFLLQGLLTFSRGGMIGTFIGMIIVLFFIRSASPWQIKKYNITRIGKYFLPAIIFVVGSFYFVNQVTNGMLLLRYQGETAGTLAGAKSKSLNTLTSGRFDIFVGDIELWLDNPVTGVGVGASKYLRSKMKNIVAHVELSRLLAEHGIFGLAYFIILLYYGGGLFKSQPNPALRGVLIALFALGLYTSFHAAMRTFISPLMIGISMISIYTPKNKQVVAPIKKESVNQSFIKI